MAKGNDESIYDPDGTRLPVKVDTTSNGEFEPRALDAPAAAANALAHDRASENAHKLGRSRRAFLTSAAGVASTLLAFNEAHARAGAVGGFFDLPGEAALDDAIAANALSAPEFIFDVQGHFVNPNGAWRDRLARQGRPYRGMPQAACGAGDPNDPLGYLECFSAEHFVKDIFLDSDTTLGVLSFVPSRKLDRPVTLADAAATRALVEATTGTDRLMIHGPVNPNTETGLSEMDELVSEWHVSAFKAYTQWGPNGQGYWLDDDTHGRPFIEKARALGVPRICVHKGLPFGRMAYEQSTCRDVGVVARDYPDMDFLIYHSGFDMSRPEGPYTEEGPHSGVDLLIKSVLDNGIGPGGNVYAELGSTWRFLMRSPDAAAHVMGKLLKYLGPDNILWGTDSIWYGSPQDQIEAFRAFQISEEFQQAYGYPAITDEIRRKIFGLNGARVYGIEVGEAIRRAEADWLGRRKAAYAPQADPSFLTHGPRTREEFQALEAMLDGPA